MNRDAKNSILLWAGTTTLVGLFWAALHFDVAAGNPDRWLWPTVGVVVAANVLVSIWNFLRDRKGWRPLPTPGPSFGESGHGQVCERPIPGAAHVTGFDP
jgi:hypothetical protein